MATTILEKVRGKELPRAWAARVGANPEAEYFVTIQPETERRRAGEEAIRLMKEIRNEAQANRISSELIQEVLDEK